MRVRRLRNCGRAGRISGPSSASDACTGGLDGPAQQEFADLRLAARASLAAFMDAVVIVDPVQYQRRRDERDDVSMPLRSLHFGPDGGGLVTFLVYPPDDLVLVVKIQWLGG